MNATCRAVTLVADIWQNPRANYQVNGARDKRFGVMMTTDANNVRERLPNRRATETLRFEHGGFPYFASLGRFADGRLAEVFLSGPKVGTDVAFAARDASIMCSIALQYGVPAEAIRHAIGRNSDGSAACPLGRLLDILAKERP